MHELRDESVWFYLWDFKLKTYMKSERKWEGASCLSSLLSWHVHGSRTTWLTARALKTAGVVIIGSTPSTTEVLEFSRVEGAGSLLFLLADYKGINTIMLFICLFLGYFMVFFRDIEFFAIRAECGSRHFDSKWFEFLCIHALDFL